MGTESTALRSDAPLEIPIKLLLVIERQFTFSRAHFGLSTLLESLLFNSHWWVRYDLTLAHRRVGGHDDFWKFLKIPPPPISRNIKQKEDFEFLFRSYQKTIEEYGGYRPAHEKMLHGSNDVIHKRVLEEFRKMVQMVLKSQQGMIGNFEATPTTLMDLNHRYRGVLLEGVNSGWQFADGFKFSEENLDQYDEIWLFGASESKSSEISIEGLKKLQSCMDGGTGVFACGDHGVIGSYFCGELPRVRMMQRWHDPNPPLTIGDLEDFEIPRMTLSGGRDNPNTPKIDESRLVESTDQSDDVPTHLEVTGYRNYHLGLDRTPALATADESPDLHPHPLFSCGTNVNASGRIDEFPDHLHEGEVVYPHLCDQCRAKGADGHRNEHHFPFQCIENWIFSNEVFQERVSDANEEESEQWRELYENEFPCSSLTNEVLPWDVSAWAWSTNRITKEKEKLLSETIEKKRFGVVGTYNGHIAENPIGRIVVDSSFHHWVDINLTGIMNRDIARPSLVVNDVLKRFGFLTPKGINSLNQIRTYHRNVALWLAPPKLQKELAIKALWIGLSDPAFSEVPELFRLDHKENHPNFGLGIQLLGRRIINTFSKVVGEVLVRSFWVPIAKGTAVEKLSLEFEALPIDLKPVVDEYLIGGIVYKFHDRLKESDVRFVKDLDKTAVEGIEKYGLPGLNQFRESLANCIPIFQNIVET